MQYRVLGRTGLRISAIAFGGGPVSGWMAELPAEQQCAVIKRALEVGINWFDTAAGYGDGQSEHSLGGPLGILGLPSEVHLVTKVRFLPEHLDDIRGRTRGSFASSLGRLRVKQVTLLQLHNSITAERGDEPTSITPKDVLKTPFFPLALYQRDEQRAGRLKALLGPACDLKSEAIRFVLGHLHVSSALIGFRDASQIDEAVDFLSDRPYPAACLRTVLSAAGEPMSSPEGHT